MTPPEDPLHLLAGLETASPPEDLRRRCLSAARAALITRTASPDLWQRLWTSRGLRLAWAATTAVLLIAHALLFVSPDRRTELAPPALLVAGAVADRELAEVADLEPLRPDRLPLLDMNPGGVSHPSTSM